MAIRMLSWTGDASCADGAAASLPWLADTPTLPRATVEVMRAVCGACPVADACAAHVQATDVTGGFWAGTDRNAPAHDPEQLDLLTDLLEEPLKEALEELGGAA